MTEPNKVAPDFIICPKMNSYGACYSQQCEIAGLQHGNWR